MNRLKHDRYQHARPGKSRLLELCCAKCNSRLCLYQKDGIGQLKRLYFDRISQASFSTSDNALTCPTCHILIGMATLYKKENRPAFQLIPGTIRK